VAGALIALGVAGLSGPLLMFGGDMLLYYRDVSSEYFAQHIAEIMGEHDFMRMTLGGLAGPVGAVLYMAAFLLAVLLIKPNHPVSRVGIFVLFALMMTIGGAYHSHFPLMGFHAEAVLNGALPQSDAIPGVGREPADYLFVFLYSYLGLGLLAWIWFGFLVVTGQTYLPRWAIVLTPFILFWVSDFMTALPQPWNVVIAGGWYNISYLPMFSLLLLTAARAPTNR
jgi:hypothetical protein